MILERLILQNFCLYQGEQTLDLAPASRAGRPAPLVLFGGINGGGKTTILDAVQLVLYGNRARCSKRAEKAYDQFLRESIHHGVDPREGAAIRLSFMYASDGLRQSYEVCRSWAQNDKGRIRERVEVKRDGEVDGWLSDNWNQVVDDMIPIGIAQLCFFDAEKIRFLAEDETSTQALGEAIKSLLGLDLAERLVADAVVLEGRIANRARKSPDLLGLEKLEAECRDKQALVERLVQELGALENPREAARNRVKLAEESFSRTGGRHWEERDARQRRLGELTHAIQESTDQLHTIAATEMPLALIVPLLQDVSRQVSAERVAGDQRTINRLLTDRDEFLLLQMRIEQVDAEAIKAVDRLMAEDRKVRFVEMPSEAVFCLSSEAERLLDNLIESGLAERRADAAACLAEHERTKRSMEEVQRALAATPDEDAVRDVALELKSASAELSQLDQQAKRVERELVVARDERDELLKRSQALRRRVIDEQLLTEEDSRIARLMARTQESMKSFLSKATARKIGRLADLVTESFRFLLRKSTLVQRVLIDPSTFAITLLDSSGREIPKHRLSEGEKQIFAISVLWGLSRASARPLPAIIDTPMARLDAKHRDQLVAHYFPHASHQVIVLSTDTEVEREYFYDLKPHIARAYHLNYDEERKVTIAGEGYFWDGSGASKKGVGA